MPDFVISNIPNQLDPDQTNRSYDFQFAFYNIFHNGLFVQPTWVIGHAYLR